MNHYPQEERPIIHRLREEYFDRLPEIRRVVGYLEAEVRYHTRHILQGLKDYEQLVTKSRVKGCESAIRALRRKKGEGGTFDPDKPDGFYTLCDLPDLAGVRTLVFPRSRLMEVNDTLQAHFAGWSSDPVPVPGDKFDVLAPKYSGRLLNVSNDIQAEFQIVPMLIGLYWEVEHAAIYKHASNVSSSRSREDSSPLKKLDENIVHALLNFEAEYEYLIRD
jgi:hypothetical protein